MKKTTLKQNAFNPLFCFRAEKMAVCILVLGLFQATRIFAQDPFAEIVRKTEPLTPAEEQKTFHLPPGFEIQLVASEPEISKPMNMAFDAKGRLWITQSREYPFAAPFDKPARDKIIVLENFGANGHAKKVTTFAEGLNIPIGLLPYKNGVIGFSIPNIYLFHDTDGNGQSDKRDLILGRFGFENDVHGLTSSFRRGFDGWIYADHGFKNDSSLRAKDGSTLVLNSGNTYRFKADGSHVEQFTHGQVNPFGLMFDPLGDLWSSDCHSSPVYLLLRGGYYPSFGKDHDGLGFAPKICEHSHGSTAIAGIVFYAATNFPREFQNNTFVGNVMTSRINRDSFVEHGSTRLAKEEPDFLTCDDPWFRPDDLRLGPDGALYVSDFYNRIIGHYEVALTHPGRDRERGRIWRIVYTGKSEADKNTDAAKNVSKNSSEPRPVSELLKLPSDTKKLLGELGNANLARRMLATDELVDQIGPDAIKPLRKLLNSNEADSFQKVHGLWVLSRLNALNDSTESTELFSRLIMDEDRLVRVHVMRVLSEKKSLEQCWTGLVIGRTQDTDPYVQRAAADALGRHVSADALAGLLALRARVPAEDSLLLHVTRMALRNQLLDSKTFASVLKIELPEADSRALADVAGGVTNAEAGEFLLQHIQKFSESREKLSDFLRHAARYAPTSRMNEVAGFARAKFADDLDFQLALFKSVQEGTQQRGAKLDPGAANWGEELAGRLLASVDSKTLDWRSSFLKEGEGKNPWVLEKRASADGTNDQQFISSLSPGGEKLTGILRSKPFTIPEQLSFFIAGHDGPPQRPTEKKNFLRLRSADDEKILMETAPPRNDVAHSVTWDLKQFAGKKGFLEITDANTGDGFAWLSVGRIVPDELVPMPTVIPNLVEQRQIFAAQLAEALHLKILETPLAELLQNENADVETRAAAAQALATINSNAHILKFNLILKNANAPMKLREKMAQVLAKNNLPEAKTALLEVLNIAPERLQKQIALALASNEDGAETLLQSVEQGKASARLLQESAVQEQLAAAKIAGRKERVENLTKNLPLLNAEKQKLIESRRVAFLGSQSSAENGTRVFTQNCAVCHQLGGQGAVVGPQLDGVGNRGVDRIIEDILDPNRNVDPAFRYTNVTLKDDQNVTGLFRRAEGEVLIFADSSGKEIPVAKKNIVEQRQSENSLMPDNFSEAIPEKDFNDLIGYLLSYGKK
ncbi:MAG: PVC-type heme-binding CxxCH protein [Verrucomicrobiota bacterium]